MAKATTRLGLLLALAALLPAAPGTARGVPGTCRLAAVERVVASAQPTGTATLVCDSAPSNADPIACESIRLAPYKYLIVIYITVEGDVYVLDTFIWDCPPYAGSPALGSSLR